MSTRHKLTAAEYEALSESYAREPIRADEVIGEPISGVEILTKGRPTGGRRPGPSRVRSLRLSADLDGYLRAVAKAEGVDDSVVIRRAIAEYIERHTEA